EVLAEVFVDRLGLGGRFDDEEVLGHGGAGFHVPRARRLQGDWRRRRPGTRPRAFSVTVFIVESRRWARCQAWPARKARIAMPAPLREDGGVWPPGQARTGVSAPARARRRTSGFPSRRRRLRC